MATNTSDLRRTFADRRSKAAVRQRRWRKLKDRLARYLVVAGGLAVIGALLLIFAYLFYVVLPLFRPAGIEPVQSYARPGEGETAAVVIQEHGEMAVRFTRDGAVVFFDPRDGRVLQRVALPLPDGAAVTAVGVSDPQDQVIAYGLADGRALLVKPEFKVSFPDGKRRITPALGYPLEAEPVVVDPAGVPLRRLAVQLGGDGATVIGLSDSGLHMTAFRREESFLTGEGSWEPQGSVALPLKGDIRQLLLDRGQTTLFVLLGDQEAAFVDVRDKADPELVQRLRLVSGDERVTAASLLVGGASLIVGTDRGRLLQWFPVRGANNHYTLQPVRDFRAQKAAITRIVPEFGRKGFLAADAEGKVGIYHATAHRTLRVAPLSEGAVAAMALGPRNDVLLTADAAGRFSFAKLRNEHPEVSWSALWGKVWYEGYGEPAYVWQSSAATSDVEPKFSLAPLAFGTLKAAFYAMLVAVPLGVAAAVYTAYFMAPGMRRIVKPTVEIMEALPTVILGFLAGLWLAPVVEAYLPGFVALLILTPLGVLVAALLWWFLPKRVRFLVPEGWESALLVPVVIVIGIVSFALSPTFEDLFFGGNVRLWLTHEMGIDFDQRNALVVGIAMGVAVIPNIFSIAEDAIFSVPRHLTFGALALGSTPWQALTRVVLLTASPGIFSAVMIGLGRAVGETMIVLMATGNTPVMDWSVFQGMRTLSANVAVEMPETEVNSTHYRVLFLSGLVLFLFTFLFNTAAETVRQRLRGKYSSL